MSNFPRRRPTRRGPWGRTMTALERAAVDSEVARLIAEIRAGTLAPNALIWRAKSANPAHRLIAALVAVQFGDDDE